MTPEWCTLTQRVVKLVRENQVQSREFQFYMETFGRDKLVNIWKEHLKKIRSAKNWQDGDEDDWTLMSEFELLTFDPSRIQAYGGTLPDGSKYVRLRSQQTA